MYTTRTHGAKAKTAAFLLAVCFILNLVICFDFTAFADYSASVIYVSPDGDDTASGSAEFPLKTLKAAFERSGDLGGTVVITGALGEPSKDAWAAAYKNLPEHLGLITITGMDPYTKEIYPDAKIYYDTPVLKGPTKIEYLTLAPVRNYAFIDTAGQKFIMGKGLSKENINIHVHDGISVEQKVLTAGSTDAVMESGEVCNYYLGGAYPKESHHRVTGDCRFTMINGKIDTLYIGFDSYAQNHISSHIDGNVYLTLMGGSIGKLKPAKLEGNKVGGFISVIAANDNLAPNMGDITAEKGVFCIITDKPDMFTATDKAGEYNIKNVPGLICYIDDEKITDETIKLHPGTHRAVFKREKADDYMGAYIKGFEDGSFRPQEQVTRAQAIQLALSACDIAPASFTDFSTVFDDIKKDDWYYNSVTYMEKNGFLPAEWVQSRKLLPDTPVTRGEFLYIISKTLIRFEGSVKLRIFHDLSQADTLYYDEIMQAVASGCIEGYADGTFRPENSLTRAEAVTVINRYLSRTPNKNTGTPFNDTDAHWAKDQIAAAATDFSKGMWQHNATETGPAYKFPENGKSAADYIPALYEQSGELSAYAIRNAVDAIAEQMKKDILNTQNTLDIYGDRTINKIYYVSEKNGNDDNSGESPDSPIKTIAAIAKLALNANDFVLFERGGVYRGSINVVSGVTYGSYGDGPKPVIMQSRRNYADPALWEKTEWENVWVCTEKLINVGVIGFDHDIWDYSANSYNELYGIIMNKNLFGFDGVHELCGDLQFYSELNGGVGNYGELYIYSTEGNPGKRFTSIEIGEKIDVFEGSASNVTIDNLSVKFTGAHGMGSGTSRGRTVTNCVWSWLGGSILSLNFSNGKPVNYGNAVEIYGGCSDYTVTNNWMYQIYDTAVTHQRSASTGDCIQENIHYSKNLMEYVFWGIESYNSPPSAGQLGGKEDTYTRVTQNFLADYNLMRLGGYGWGSITRHRGAQLMCCSTISDNNNCSSVYNILDRAYGNLLIQPKNYTEKDDRNIYIQHLGQPLGRLKSSDTTICSQNAAVDIAEKIGDKNAVVIIIDPAVEPIVRNIPKGLATPGDI